MTDDVGDHDLGPHERRVLAVLADCYLDEACCQFFREIARRSDLTERAAKRATRRLARRGLAEYVRGLVDVYGMMAGSGYGCTPRGRDLARHLPNPEEAA